ncbi:MAG: DEAD/DEAH box helicase, partial [Bacteroidota bacterium]
QATEEADPLPFDTEGFHFQFKGQTLSLDRIPLTTARASNLTLADDAESPLEPFLQEVSEGEASRQIAPLRLLGAVWQFTLQLAEKSAMVPQVISSTDETMHLRWIPAMVDSAVRATAEGLMAAFPADWVQVSDRQATLRSLPRQEQLFFLVDALLTWLLDANELIEAVYDDPVRDFFFGVRFFQAEDFGDEETPYAIQQWLQRFYLADRELVPVLKIEEDEPDFLLSFAIEDKTQQLSPMFPLSQLFEDPAYQERRLSVLQDLASLAEYLPDVQAMVASRGKREARLDSQSFVRVLMDSLPALELVGIRVLLPKSLRKIIRPQASLSLESFENPDAAVGYLNLQDMLDFHWDIALGDQFMNPQEFLDKVEELRGLVKIQDQYVLIDEKDMQQLLKKMESLPDLDSKDLLQASLSESYDGSPVRLSPEAKKLIHELIELEQVDPPEGLLATFRPYQHRGYSWLYKNHRIGFGSILADDMGLGKTLQVIAFLSKLAQEGQLAQKRALVVVPTPLLSNWQRECQKFAPELDVDLFHGPGRTLNVDEHQVIVTSYGVARSDQKLLAKSKWRALVIDEAQAIKNPGTAQTKALKKIKADTRIAMSGTPVENRLSEYWSIFDFTNQGYLATLNRFKKTYMVPIEKDRDQARLQEFRQITAPFILRRVKTDKSIISDLPDKIEQDQFCTLTPEQTALYQGVVETNLEQIEENEGIARAGMIFKLMTALKQICNHPSLYLKKADPDPALSGKASLLLNLLSQIREQGEKVLIFTQYKTMGDLLVQLLSQHFPEEPLFLHGGLTRKNRDHLVDTFQEQPFAWAFVLSLKAAGTGLNLTAANHVIHYDLWWNPAVEAQATDRAFRIGQQKNVQVNRFITQGTFEEKINAMIQQKRELADLTVGSGEQWIGDLSNQELGEVFRLVGE